MVSITISPDPAPSEAAASSNVDIESSSDTTSSDVSSENETDPYVVQVSILRNHPIWDDFMSYVEKAKAAKALDPTDWLGARVFIDFDPRADFVRDESETSGLSSLRRSVVRALGLDPTKEFFSEWGFIRSRHEAKKLVFSN
jgi:hypothetical protein